MLLHAIRRSVGIISNNPNLTAYVSPLWTQAIMRKP